MKLKQRLQQVWRNVDQSISDSAFDEWRKRLRACQWNIDSNDILSERKYCQLFTHESNTFLGEQYLIPPIQMNGGGVQRMPETMPETAPSPWGTGTPIYYINASAYPTQHAKQQLDRFTQFRTAMQQRPHWLQWDAPNSPQKLPLSLWRSPPKSNTPIPRPTPNGIQV